MQTLLIGFNFDMNSNTIIKLTNIYKKYYLQNENTSLVKIILNNRKNNYFWALKNINLSIRRGEKIGIIGVNGAGKSTLLRIISGIITPTRGKVITKGKIVTLMDIEAGFHPDLSGLENIYLNGMLVGMRRSEVERKKKSIISYSGIKRFINNPFFTYSNGMKFRLAIAVAMASQCDVLLMDEILISGDESFQKKITDTLSDLQKNKKITTIICSHAPLTLLAFADIFFKIHNGQIKLIKKTEVENLAIIHNAKFHDNFRSTELMNKSKQYNVF